jgi:hypothetical protein
MSDARHRSTLARNLAFAILFAAGVLLGAAVFDSASLRNIGRELRSEWQAFVWDRWSQGQLDWAGYRLSLPVRQYGWFQYDDGDLEIVTRTRLSGASLTLKVSRRADWPYESYVKATCIDRKLCANVKSDTRQIGQREARLVTFLEVTGQGTSRANGYMLLAEPKLLCVISAETSESLERMVDLAVRISEQIVEQSMAVRTRRERQ